MPMVPKCTSAASAIRMAKSACRVGGGSNACGPRNVSSMLSAPVPVTILASVHRRSPIPIPTVGQAQQFCRRHLDQRQRLPTFCNQGIVLVPHDPKSAPKSHAFELIEPTFNREAVAKFCGMALVDVRPDSDSVLLRRRHVRLVESEVLRQESACDLDDPQICD